MSSLSEPYDVNKLDKVIVFRGSGKNNIEVKRDKNFLYLYKEEDNKKYFRFDLNSGLFDRINIYKTRDSKITPVSVQNITKWFTNCTLYTKDVHFGRLMIFAKGHRKFSKYSSPVRFIQMLGDDVVQNLEKWEALGVEIEEIQDIFGKYLGPIWGPKDIDDRKNIYLGKRNLPKHNISITKSPSDCSKQLLNHIQQIEEPIRVNALLHMIDRYNNGELTILENLIELNNSDEFYRLFCEDGYCYLTGASWRSRTIKESILDIMMRYNLDEVAFCRFIKRQKNVEKNDIVYLIMHNHYRDYLECEYHLKDGSLSKMNKYPKNFRTTFHQVQVEYQAIKDKVDLKKFQGVCEKNSNLVHVGQKYKMILPTTPKDIENEASELHHCVRSYITPMTEGKTLIMFLRDKKDEETPLITVEVKNHAITQAYGDHDSKPLPEHLKFLRMWAKTKDLKMACWGG